MYSIEDPKTVATKPEPELSVKWIALCISVFLGATLAFPVTFWTLHEIRQREKYGQIFAEIAAKDFGPFNHLCTTYIDITVKEKWFDSNKLWLEMCMDHNKDYFDRYAP